MKLQNNYFFLTCLIFFFTLLLSACGFHLRGSLNVPPGLSPLYVDSQDPISLFTKELKQELMINKVALTENSKDAAAILKILRTDDGQQLISSSTTSQVNTYAVSFTVTFEVLGKDGQVLLPASSVSSSQNVTISSNQILAGTSEQQQITPQLHRSAISLMFNRLSSRKLRNSLHNTP